MDTISATDVDNIRTLLDGGACAETAFTPALTLASLRFGLGTIFGYPAHAAAAPDDGNADADAALAAWLGPAFRAFRPADWGIDWPNASALWAAAADAVPDLASLAPHSTPSPAPGSTPTTSGEGASTGSLAIHQADRNQYSLGAISSCTIMAMEAAVQVMGGAEPGVALVDAVLDVGAAYTDTAHLSADEVHASVARFATALSLDQMSGLMADTLGEVIHMLETRIAANPPFVPSAAVITKAPETVMLAALPASPSDATVAHWVLFDSHARPDHPGAAFLITPSAPLMRAYLASLFPTIDLGDGDFGIQGAMLNMADATLFSLAVSPPDIASLPPVLSSSLAPGDALLASPPPPPALSPVSADDLTPDQLATLTNYLTLQSLPTDLGFFTADELARHLSNATAWFAQ